jgi:hypothetical protein
VHGRYPITAVLAGIATIVLLVLALFDVISGKSLTLSTGIVIVSSFIFALPVENRLK